MRNLKRVLSLALAAMMLIGMMVVGASAAGNYDDFTDKDKIVNTEAVQILNALGVINGKEDGSYFDPTGSVTRAEMAKMITIICLGDVDVSAFQGTATDLKDISSNWAEAYIKYCYSQGVIAGRGNGVFDPTANVTTSEAAKMLLVAIGYNSDVQGYTGSQWAINVTRDAQISGFFDNLSVTSTQALTRDQAAQMIYNAVSANTVVKTPTLTVGTNEISYTYSANGAPLLSKTFSTKEYVGVMDGITYADGTKKYTYADSTNFENKVDNTDTKASFATTEDYTALQGEEVSVIAKTEKNGDVTVLGIYATGTSTVINANVSALEANGAKVKIDGTSYELENGLTTGGLVDTDSYNTIKLVDSDANGKLDTAVVTVVTPAKVTFVNSDEIIAGGTTYKYADNEIASGLAKNDYVTIVKNLNGVYVINKLDAISGKVDANKTINTEACARVDGVWYVKNGTTLNVDTTYTFYAVNGVVVSGSVDASTADIANLVMVLAVDTEMLTQKAIVMDANGTQTTVTIDKSGATAALGSMYTYTETENGYKLTAAATIGTDYIWTAGADGDVSLAGDTISSKSVADDAVIFIRTTDGGKIITGKQFKNLADTLLDTAAAIGSVGANKVWDNSYGSFYSTVSGLQRITYAGLYFNGKAADLGVTSGNVNYAYVTSASYTVSNNYTTYTIWNGSENLTVIDKGATSVVKGDILTYDAIDGDYITGVAKATLSAPAQSGTDGVAAVYGTEGDYVYLDGTSGTNKYKITSDTKYLYVDSNASKAEEIGKASGELALADKYGASIYMDNVIVMVNASGELELIVVDVKNNMTSAVNATHSATGFSVANATVTLSKTANIKAGDAIEITVTATGSVTTESKTLTNAKAADGTTSITIPNMSTGETYKVTIFADGAGDVSFT